MRGKVLCLSLMVMLGCFVACGDSESGSANTDEWNVYEGDGDEGAADGDADGDGDGDADGDGDGDGQCEPMDNGYRYYGHSVEECAAINFTCEEHEEYFQDDCGCGCRPAEADECPSEEDGYRYYGESIAECAAMLFTCNDPEEYFEAGECGCGCYLPAGACEAMDVEADGECSMLIGAVYLGPDAGCEYISGCECRGSDCDSTFDSIEACQQAYAACLK